MMPILIQLISGSLITAPEIALPPTPTQEARVFPEGPGRVPVHILIPPSPSRKHEWFQKDLVGYLFPPPHDTQVAVIDQDAIKEVCEVTTTVMLPHYHNY